MFGKILDSFWDRFLDRCLDRNLDKWLDRYLDGFSDRFLTRFFDALDLDSLETLDIFQSCLNAASIFIRTKCYEREEGIKWLSENLNYHSEPNEIHTSLT